MYTQSTSQIGIYHARELVMVVYITPWGIGFRYYAKLLIEVRRITRYNEIFGPNVQKKRIREPLLRS